MAKFYIHTGGGLGDMLKHYFWGNHGWKYAKSLKNKHPDIKIKLITTCCNPIGHELFRFCPYIDEVEPHPWVDPNRPWKQLASYVKGYKHLAKVEYITPSAPTKIYLSQEDQNTFKEYLPEKDYIVMHPFAGDAIRINLPIEEYFPLAKLLIEKFDYKVVVLGGKSQRVIGKISRTINEEFPYKANGIINLIDKVNLRVASALTLSASHFIGSNSAFYCIRLATKKSASISMPNRPVLTQRTPVRIRKNGIEYIITKQGKHLHISEA